MAPKTDQGSLLKFIEENKRIIFKICNVYCKNRHDREDLQQEIIYQLWRSYPTYKPEYKFTTWMYRVALNIAISFYRKTKLSDNIITLDEPVEIEDKPDNTSEIEKNISTLYQFINDLNKLQ